MSKASVIEYYSSRHPVLFLIGTIIGIILGVILLSIILIEVKPKVLKSDLLADKILAGFFGFISLSLIIGVFSMVINEGVKKENIGPIIAFTLISIFVFAIWYFGIHRSYKRISSKFKALRKKHRNRQRNR
jgi:hypothetical protein